jgi:hypothetical protein
MTQGKLSKELVPRAKLAKLLEDRRNSFAARVEGSARSAFLQREIRRRLHQHIGQNISPMGANDEKLTRARRELLMASLLPTP